MIQENFVKFFMQFGIEMFLWRQKVNLSWGEREKEGDRKRKGERERDDKKGFVPILGEFLYHSKIYFKKKMNDLILQ